MEIFQKLLLALLLGAPGWVLAQQDRPPLQYDLAVGLHAYYLPALGTRWNGPEPVAFAGIHQPLNRKQSLGLTLRLGYSRGQYQGDALQAQLLFGLAPVLAQHLELGFKLGVGYQFSFYPSPPSRWDEGQWVAGKTGKGVFQAPLQFSLGYRSIHAGRLELQPYLAYQLNVLFGYSPDLSPLPVSNALLGFRISSLQ